MNLPVEIDERERCGWVWADASDWGIWAAKRLLAAVIASDSYLTGREWGILASIDFGGCFMQQTGLAKETFGLRASRAVLSFFANDQRFFREISGSGVGGSVRSCVGRLGGADVTEVEKDR